MAAIVLRENISLAELNIRAFSDHISKCLPSYSRPIFIRILKELPTTTTHKLQKNDLRNHAYHLAQVEDDLLVMKPGSDCYSRLDSDFYDQVMQRQIRF
jgi:solute carrier family 27 fatty acid transporter 1/4